jgi:hypothetical protein
MDTENTGQFDSYTSDQMSETEPADDKCWACGKVNCTCDEDYMEAKDEEMRRADEDKNQGV